MKIAAINTVDYGSTGKIMIGIARHARRKGYDYQTFSIARRKKQRLADGHHYYLSYPDYMIHYILGRATGANGFFSIGPTIRLIHTLHQFDPDIIHLHNIHGFSINIPILIYYLKRQRIRTVWTLHDCWTFTGHCAHYERINCTKWIEGCYTCPLFKDYPESCVDNSKWMWKKKKKWFNSISGIIFVTPSEWLKSQVLLSFLKENTVQTIHNGISFDAFQPHTGSFCKKYHLEGKYIVLGVAFGWGEKKGLDIFQKLADSLPEQYTVVLVGTNEETDKKLNSKIVSVHRTSDQSELAEIYSDADVFVNPTREDTFPTVNIEALACGTPVVTFATGGSPEIIDDSCGTIIPQNDYNALRTEVIRICEKKPFTSENCIKRAHEFDVQKSYDEYIEIYEHMLEGRK